MGRAYRDGRTCPIVENGSRCSKPAKTRDWCGMHYERWRKHGDPLIVVTPRREGTHRMTKSPEFSSWRHMKRRCLNPNDDAYPGYGGRGITVHEPWAGSFEAFYKYMGPMPGPGYSIDRYPDNDGNYEPGNVRWATMLEQSRNKRQYSPNRAKTHCPRGHEYTEENTYRYRGTRRCLRCMLDAQREKRARMKAESPRTPKTHCKNGHEFTPENTIMTAKRGRACRQCMRDRGQEYKERNRDLVRAASRTYMAKRRAEGGERK